jgi:hypothetical protein
LERARHDQRRDDQGGDRVGAFPAGERDDHGGDQYGERAEGVVDHLEQCRAHVDDAAVPAPAGEHQDADGAGDQADDAEHQYRAGGDLRRPPAARPAGGRPQ